jgi:hypothetical protein
MFRFFRQLRESFIGKNQSGKYLKYALGEIVLVVIGILIALQINIEKEAYDGKKVTAQLLTGIQADLKLETERIDFLIAYYGKITEGIQHILQNHQGIETNSNKELGRYFLNAFEFRKFSKFNTNYQTLYGSALLQEIEDKKLTEEIVTYYSKQFLEWSLEIYQQKAGAFDFNNVPQFHPLDKLQTGTEYSSIPNFRLGTGDDFKTDFREFINEPEVLNFLVDLLHQSELVFYNLKTYRESNLNLSNRIEQYLHQ